MSQVAVWWSEPLPDKDSYRALLDGTEHRRRANYRQEADRKRFLTGRVMVKTVLADQFGIRPEDIRLDAACADCGKPHGPPRLVEPTTPVVVSISHSGDRVGVAITDGEPVGLDVESATRKTDDALIDYALNARERADLDRLSGADRAGAFLHYWTRKEALMKATGKGLRIPLSALTLSPPGEPPALLASDEDSLVPQRVWLADLHPGPGYHASLAVLGDTEPTVTERWFPS